MCLPWRIAFLTPLTILTIMKAQRRRKDPAYNVRWRQFSAFAIILKESLTDYFHILALKWNEKIPPEKNTAVLLFVTKEGTLYFWTPISNILNFDKWKKLPENHIGKYKTIPMLHVESNLDFIKPVNGTHKWKLILTLNKILNNNNNNDDYQCYRSLLFRI